MKNSLIKEVRLRSIERITAAVVIAFGLFIQIYMKNTPTMYSSKSAINSPAFFPTIAAYGLIVIGVALLIKSFFTDPQKMTQINFYSFILVLIWVGFAVVAPYIGFILAGAVCLALTMLLFGVRKWKLVLLVSVLAPTIIYLILGVGLHVKFPTLLL